MYMMRKLYAVTLIVIESLLQHFMVRANELSVKAFDTMALKTKTTLVIML